MSRRSATIVVALVIAALVGVALLAVPGSPLEKRPTLGLGFPRVRDDVRYLFAAYAPGWRSANALVMTRLPKDGKDGSPAPIVHRFLLEPVQGPAPPAGKGPGR